MISFHILLIAEDQRNGLIHNGIIQKKHIFFFISHRTCTAFLKINGSSEYLDCLSTEHTGSIHPAVCLFTGMNSFQIHIQTALPAKQISNI